MEDVGKFAAQHGFAAGEPEVREGWHGCREFPDLFPSEITPLVQFLPVKTCPAFGIADGGNKENYQLQTLFTFEELEGPTSLHFRWGRHPDGDCTKSRVVMGKCPLGGQPTDLLQWRPIPVGVALHQVV